MNFKNIQYKFKGQMRHFKKIFFVLCAYFLIMPYILTGLQASPVKLSLYENVLQQFVDDDGKIDYENLKFNNKNLDVFVKSLNNFSFDEYVSLNKEQKLIFLINVYNSVLIDATLKKYPLQPKWYHFGKHKINDLRNIRNPRESTTLLFGEIRTLEDILSRLLNLDPSGNGRAIFALTFLRSDGPKMRNSLYNWQLLSRDLDEQVRKFVFDEKNYRLDKGSAKLYLSGFLKDYAYLFTNTTSSLSPKYKDFENKIVTFLLDFVLSQDRDYLQEYYCSIVFNESDYKLNERSKK